MIQLVFVDLDPDFATEIKTLVNSPKPYKLTTFTGDIRKVPRHNSAIVSPANSMGWMDGGIDDIYRKMFPGVQRSVQDAIKSHNYKSALGRYFLPIGSALIVQVEPTNYLICAPTMWHPEPVPETRNAYWAFRAVLALVDKFNKGRHDKISTIVCPGLCTGCGEMSPSTCARQIHQALADHVSWPPYPDAKPQNRYVVWNEPNADEQSDRYQNQQFKEINL
jgi:O-acetyl-ADP-ribose deacetylase (regulator of RNase III)